MAHTETFDPKRYVPFSKGMAANDMFSTFPAIDTAVDHIKFSQGLEKTAAVMDRGTLIRSYTAGDLGFILHTPPSVSVAHRLCPAADRRRAAHWRGDRPHARAEESGGAGFY